MGELCALTGPQGRRTAELSWQLTAQNHDICPPTDLRFGTKPKGLALGYSRRHARGMARFYRPPEVVSIPRTDQMALEEDGVLILVPAKAKVTLLSANMRRSIRRRWREAMGWAIAVSG